MTDISILRGLRNVKNYSEMIILGENMVSLTPLNPELYEELCIAYWHQGQKRKSYECLDKITQLRPRCSILLDRCISNKLFFEKDHEEHKWTYIHPSYEKNPVVTVTITSCKRLPLFLRTIESFMRCCVDPHFIKEYVCVDDNSSEEDRNVMIKTFPFIRFIFKGSDEKGHAVSMQILTKEVKTPFMLHLEDDWLFFNRVCISDMLEIMKNEESIKQVAINKNYSSLPEKQIKGGEEKWTAGNLRYFLHEQCITEQEKTNFISKHGNCPSCNYWPHFTLQPSLIDTTIFSKISFEQTPHFEMSFAKQFVKYGWKTAFAQEVTTRHIGKNLGEDGQNAYELNNEKQF
jgi:hypothetical protein